MAAVKQGLRKETEALVERLRQILISMGGDTPSNRTLFARQASEVVEQLRRNGHGEIEQFGSLGAGKSTPDKIARQSLHGLLDAGMGATEKSLARWSAVADALESRNGFAEVEPVPEPPEPEPPEPEGEPEPEDDWRERAELAEAVVADVEKERDAAKAEASSAKAETERLEALLTERAEQVSALRESLKGEEALRKDLRSARSSAAATRSAFERAQASREQEREEHAEALAALQQESAKTAENLDEVRRMYDELADTHAEVERDLVSAQQVTADLQEREETLVRQITEMEMGLTFREEYQRALLAEVEAANGAPRPWVLERLDKLAGI